MLHKPRLTFDRLGQVIFTLREIIKIIAQVEKKLLVGMFIVNALWGLSSVPGFYIQKLILDHLVDAIGNPNWQSVVYSIGLLILLRVLLDLTRTILSSVSNYLRRILSGMFVARVELIIGQKLAELDMATIDDPDFQDKFNKIQRESGNRSWGLVTPLADIPNYFVGFLSAVGILILLHPLVAVGVLFFSIPRFVVNSKFIKRDYELDNRLANSYRLWGWLNYYLVRNRNFMELKILDLSGYLSRKLRLIQEDVEGQKKIFRKKREIAGFWGNLPLTVLEFGISVWLVVLTITAKITIGSFTLYLQTVQSAENNLSGLVNSLLDIYENYIYVADMVWFLNLKPKIAMESGKLILTKNSFDIEFRDVWFRYKENQKWVMKGVNLQIGSGEKMAVVGLNGAGKSTLIKLLARFYDPQKGEVLVNGVNLKEYDLGIWRKKLAVLFQEFENYPFSVNESVGYGDVERIDDLEGIKEAVTKTGMDDFVEKLPKKYENPLDSEFEGGVRPSIGQIQRLGISRMIFRKNAGVIIMDEPTSSVDPEAEEKIFGELVELAKDKILIFVTQRFSTVRLADRVIVIDGGRIVENGTHKELMKEDGEYARLFNLQAKGYK